MNYNINNMIPKWKEFNLTSLFKPVQSKGDIKMSELILGDIPLVSAVKGNNGIAAYIACGDGVAEKFQAGCITADMFGHVFYQEKEFYAVSHGRVNILQPLIKLNKFQGLFIAKVLEYQFNIRNSYSRMLTKELLKKCKILLPVTDNGDIDLQFMEFYMTDLQINQNNILKEIPDYFLNEGYDKACWYLENIDKNEFEKKYSGIEFKQCISLYDREWKEFNLTKFFNPVLSKGDIKINQIIPGDIPLVSAIKSNNGIATFIATSDGKAQLFKKGCLTADMFGHVYYQPKDFYSVSHGRVNILIPLIDLNVYQGIFIAKVLEYQFNIRNSYSRMLTNELLKKCKISLPVINDMPDWEFMENYIKSLKFSKNI